MIKRYLQFIKESKINGFNSLGEWIESLIKDDYIKNIVFRYLDSKQDVNLSNAINILDEKTQQDIKSQIDKYLQEGIPERDTEVSAHVDIDELNETSIIGNGTNVTIYANGVAGTANNFKGFATGNAAAAGILGGGGATQNCKNYLRNMKFYDENYQLKYFYPLLDDGNFGKEVYGGLGTGTVNGAINVVDV